MNPNHHPKNDMIHYLKSADILKKMIAVTSAVEFFYISDLLREI